MKKNSPVKTEETHSFLRFSSEQADRTCQFDSEWQIEASFFSGEIELQSASL